MKKKSSLFMLNLYFLILVIIFSLFLLFYVKKNQHIFIDSFHKNQSSILKNTMNVYVKYFRKSFEEVFANIYKDINIDNIEEKKEYYLETWKEYQSLNKDITWIYVGYGKNDILITKKWQKPDDYNLSSRLWYQLGLVSPDEIQWSNPYRGPTTNVMTLSLVKGIRGSDDKVKGVLGVDMSLATLNRAMEEVEVPKESTLLLLNENNKLLAYVGIKNDNEDFKSKPWYKQVLTANEGYLETDNGNLIDFHTDPITNWKLISITPKKSLDKYIMELKSVNITFLILIIILIFITYEVQVYKINKRNVELINHIKELRGDGILKVKEKLNIKRKSEGFYSNVYEEIHNLALTIEKFQKELELDQESSLYRKNYFEKNKDSFNSENYELILFRYINLQELVNNYGSGVLELVLKRGGLVLKNRLSQGEVAIRYSMDTLAMVVKTDNKIDVEEIIKEIEEYKWKLTNLNVKVEVIYRAIKE